MNKRAIHKVNLKKYKILGKYSILQFMLAIGVAAFVVAVIIELIAS